jgi:Protein of unknown function (DUF3405)
MSKDVILYRSHILDSVVEREIRRLSGELLDYDHFVLGYRDFGASAGFDSPIADPVASRFTLLSFQQLGALPYPCKVPEGHWSNEGGGNDDLPILWFFRQNDHYDHYWCIEYDVRYTGDWRILFDDLATSKADLLATTINDREEFPQWEWWRTLAWTKGEIARQHHARAFQPFCRLSNRALKAIDAAYRDGVGGHYEVTWPTICRMNNLTLEDIGGNGPYTPPERVNKHYINDPSHWSLYPGTFLFRPSILDRDFVEFSTGRGPSLTQGPKLWHPVKW